MNVFLMTRDETMHLLPAYSYFFNKNWSEKQQVWVLTFAIPDFDLPRNFNIFLLGDRNKYRNKSNKKLNRANAILDKFRHIRPNVFIYLWDEHFIITKVNLGLIKRLYAEVVEGRAKRALLARRLNYQKFSTTDLGYSDEIIKLPQKAINKSVLVPAVWRREYFFKRLRRNQATGEFKAGNIKKTRIEEAAVLAPKKENAANIFNVYQKGRFNIKGFRGLSISDEERKIIIDSTSKRHY